MRIILSPSVKITDCNTLIICAMLAILTRSHLLLNILRFIPARLRHPLGCFAGIEAWISTWLYLIQAPIHLPIKPTRFSGSYLSIISVCFEISSSIYNVISNISNHSFSLNSTAEPLGWLQSKGIV